MVWDKHLPSVLALAGSVLTGLFTLLGVWLANRSSFRQLTAKLAHESDRETRDTLRKRLEELYSLVGLWRTELAAHHLTYLRVMDGHLTYNQALDLTLQRRPEVDANRMFTLAELYFPSAHRALEEMISLRDRAAAVHANFTEEYRASGEPSAKHARLLRDILSALDKAVNVYRGELAAYAKNV